MKIVCSAAVAAGLLTAALMPEMAHADGKDKVDDVAVKFCPAEQVHTYPLESRRNIQSLMLQNVLVSHAGSTDDGDRRGRYRPDGGRRGERHASDRRG